MIDSAPGSRISWKDAPDGPGQPACAQAVERFLTEAGRVWRVVLKRDGSSIRTEFHLAAEPYSCDASGVDQYFLRQRRRPAYTSGCGEPLRIADLFCGCGSLSLGAMEAARALGRPAHLQLAADINADSLRVLSASLGSRRTRHVDLATALDGKKGSKATSSESRLLRGTGTELDLVLAGPPCQGHSRLNNHTRHDDDKNSLYLKAARFVELTTPKYILLENVATIGSDKRQSLIKTVEYLSDLEYEVEHSRIDLSWLGVPQSRLRHVLIGCRKGQPPISIQDVLEEFRPPGSARTLEWALSDLLNQPKSAAPFDKASQPTTTNAKRIKWLHGASDRYNLPNEKRPDCHRGDHSYKSMYGKLRWDAPAQTITSGYGSMGQGRYVHPKEPRTITPHEAARLQMIPDFFRFDKTDKRTAWAEMIGNAAPFKLSYYFALAMFR